VPLTYLVGVWGIVVSVADPEPHGSAFNLPSGSESGFGMRIRI
jgi:hypothetical protein